MLYIFLWFWNYCAGNVIENKLALLSSAKPKRNTTSEEYITFHLNARTAASVSKLKTIWVVSVNTTTCPCFPFPALIINHISFSYFPCPSFQKYLSVYNFFYFNASQFQYVCILFKGKKAQCNANIFKEEQKKLHLPGMWIIKNKWEMFCYSLTCTGRMGDSSWGGDIAANSTVLSLPRFQFC